MAASRATFTSRAWAAPALAASQRTTERAASNGAMRSTPSSVSFWTTSSGLAPFTSANATPTAGDGRSATTHVAGELGRPRRPCGPAAQRPAPSPTMSGVAVADAPDASQVVVVGVVAARADRGRSTNTSGPPPDGIADAAADTTRPSGTPT